MNREDLPSILCVDDEPRVVDGLALHLRRDYQVLTANGAQSALQILKEHGPLEELGEPSDRLFGQRRECSERWRILTEEDPPELQPEAARNVWQDHDHAPGTAAVHRMASERELIRV